MHSRSQEDAFFLSAVCEITYDDVIAVISCNRLAQSLLLDFRLEVWISLQRSKVFLKLCIGVGVAVGDVDSVVVVGELQTEV